MGKEFEGKRILVTGAGAGIGRALALRLVELGADVYGLSKTKENLESLQLQCPEIKVVCADLSRWEETKAAVRDLPAMDGLVNNAGTAFLNDFLDVTEEDIDRTMAVNLKSMINVSQEVAKKMIASGRPGSIVNVSSQASIKPLLKHSVYCASKAAMDQVGRVMAMELARHKIRTNSVNPTVVLTELGKMAWSDPAAARPMLDRIPLGKFAEVEDVVEAVVFLLSEKSAMINGVVLPVDGGYCAT